MNKTPLIFEGRMKFASALALTENLRTLRPSCVCLYGLESVEETTYVPVYTGENGTLFTPSGADTWRAYTEMTDGAEPYAAVLDAPLTDLALALLADSRVPGRICRLVLAGGSLFGGDASPCAEANFFADPEAAEVVLAAGLNSLILPLEAVERARGISDAVSDEDLRAVLALLLADGEEGFVLTPAWARVETKGRITRGKLVTDLFSDKKLEKNARVVTGVEPDALRRRLATAFSRG